MHTNIEKQEDTKLIMWISFIETGDGSTPPLPAAATRASYSSSPARSPQRTPCLAAR